jgi:hypothetical protein
MPAVTTVEELLRGVAEFVVADVDLVTEPGAAAAAERSLADSGLLLLGEVHGVRENPLLIWALMQAFGLTCLALEWPDDLMPVIDTFLAHGTLADHWQLWSGDGRITAGHLAMLAERAEARPFEVNLFDGIIGAQWTWSQRDAAMAGRILGAAKAGTRMLVVAGNAHTPTSRTELGVPLGSCLAGHRPGVRDIRISYAGGDYYNGGSRQFAAVRPRPGHILLYQQDGALVLDLPAATEAVVPHRSSGIQPQDGFFDVIVAPGRERGCRSNDREA